MVVEFFELTGHVSQSTCFSPAFASVDSGRLAFWRLGRSFRKLQKWARSKLA